MASRRGMSSFAALVLVGLALALVLLFLWRVWSYYRQIRRGEMVELPQFYTQFTPAGRETAAATIVDTATPDDPSIGPAATPLVIVEFIDYECPFSAMVSSTVREMTAAYGDRVRFVVRDFPISELHP